MVVGPIVSVDKKKIADIIEARIDAQMQAMNNLIGTMHNDPNHIVKYQHALYQAIPVHDDMLDDHHVQRILKDRYIAAGWKTVTFLPDINTLVYNDANKTVVQYRTIIFSSDVSHESELTTGYTIKVSVVE